MASSNIPPRPQHPSTRLVTTGRDPAKQHGFVNPPVYHGSTVLYPTMESYVSGKQEFTYGRQGTPTVRRLEEAIAELEGGAGTVLAPSGLAAIATALLAYLQAGDNVLMTDSVYRPSRRFCDQLLARFGVETTYYDPLIGAGISELMRDNTRVVYAESPGSQTFEMQDLPAIAEAAHARDAFVLFDNTWASPLYFKPFQHGADISIQAATKYIGGHADLMMGTITANERALPDLQHTHRDLGQCAGPDDVYLALRGLRTLGVRLERHWEAGLEMARWLRSRPEVARVLHPALEGDPGYEIWKRDFLGASGLFAIELKPCDKEMLAAMLEGLAFFGMGASWGGYESLCVPFDVSPYRTATKWAPEGPCLRIHVGLENVDDLKADLERGFERMRALQHTA